MIRLDYLMSVHPITGPRPTPSLGVHANWVTSDKRAQPMGTGNAESLDDVLDASRSVSLHGDRQVRDCVSFAGAPT